MIEIYTALYQVLTIDIIYMYMYKYHKKGRRQVNEKVFTLQSGDIGMV